MFCEVFCVFRAKFVKHLLYIFEKNYKGDAFMEKLYQSGCVP